MSSSMPILQRMDRLDRLLQFLEEKHCLSSKHSSSSSTTAACESSELAQDRESYKSLSSAIEEVHCKGTLIERVAMLESRVLQVKFSSSPIVEICLLICYITSYSIPQLASLITKFPPTQF
ncbi:hypothetical protein ACLB2K_000834 [Fragaria x ananassa]